MKNVYPIPTTIQPARQVGTLVEIRQTGGIVAISKIELAHHYGNWLVLRNVLETRFGAARVTMRYDAAHHCRKFVIA